MSDVVDDRGLGGRLSQAMTLRGLSQGQLEEAASLPDSYVSKLIRGKRPNIGFQTLENISAALRVRYLWLAFGEGPMEAEPSAPATRTVVYDERYPNLSDAVIAARALGVREEAIRRTHDLALKREDDPSPREWLRKIESIDDDVRREAETPEKAISRRLGHRRGGAGVLLAA